MSKLTTGSFSIEDLESVQITINNIVGAAKEAAEAKGRNNLVRWVRPPSPQLQH